jgi:peptidyl-prolyl cis-trans isomerase D
MLQFLRRGQRWVNAVLVVALGAVFVFYMGWSSPSGTGDAGPGGAVIAVGHYQFRGFDFDRARQQREAELERVVGENFDRKQLGSLIEHQAAEMLVQGAILALEAERMGLSVSTAEIERAVVDAGIFHGEDGKFDPELFRSWATQNFGSERAFLDSQRLEMLRGKAIQVMRATAGISDAEVRRTLELRLEEISIGTLRFDTSSPPADFQVSDSAVADFVAKREAALRERYEARRAEYDRPEEVQARHILFALAPDADAAAVEAAREKAVAAQKRIEGGESFESVAAELSDDLGTKQQGGDLGFFPRGRMVKPFEDAAFALEPGKLAPDPVRSDFGFHVIRIEARHAAELTPFEQVRDALARELLADEAALAAARQRADAIAAKIAAGGDLEDVARAEGLPVERSNALRRRPDGYVPGLGAAQDLLAAAFALEPGKSSARVFEVGNQLVLVKLLERQRPSEDDLAAQIETERQALLAQKQNAQIDAWISTRRSELESAGELYTSPDLFN